MNFTTDNNNWNYNKQSQVLLPSVNSNKINENKTLESKTYKNMYPCSDWIYNWTLQNYVPPITGSSIASIIGIAHHTGEGFASQRPSLIRSLILKERSSNNNLLPDIQEDISVSRLPKVKNVTAFGNSQEERLDEFIDYYKNLMSGSCNGNYGMVSSSKLHNALNLPSVNDKYKRKKQNCLENERYKKKRNKTILKNTSYISKLKKSSVGSFFKKDNNRIEGNNNNKIEGNNNKIEGNNNKIEGNNELPFIYEKCNDSSLSYEELSTFWGIQMEYRVSDMLQRAFLFKCN